ncbi:MAG: sel1 repeat family protein [Campylobacteraceae bacterium]|jgi:TPR repeat protein|nr:sel1 repeat family protein [Campylobacteraceae bacterium]
MKKIVFFLCLVYSFCFSQSQLEAQKMDELCFDGDANVCYMLGKLNERSSVLRQGKNTPESRKYYKKAAIIYQEQCDMEDDFSSCAILGNMHINDQGIGMDHFKAKEYFTKACENDEQEGCVGLGKLHLNGVSVRKDSEVAKKYFESTCTEKNQNGCLFLAQMYEKKSKKLAKEYYGKACDLNSQIGCLKYSEFK